MYTFASVVVFVFPFLSFLLLHVRLAGCMCVVRAIKECLFIYIYLTGSFDDGHAWGFSYLLHSSSPVPKTES